MHGRISDPEMTTYPPQVALALRTPGWDLARYQWGWGFHTVRGGIDRGVDHFRPQFVGLYIYMEGFPIRRWDLILLGWRWFHEPQPISNQPEWG